MQEDPGPAEERGSGWRGVRRDLGGDGRDEAVKGSMIEEAIEGVAGCHAHGDPLHRDAAPNAVQSLPFTVHDEPTPKMGHTSLRSSLTSILPPAAGRCLDGFVASHLFSCPNHSHGHGQERSRSGAQHGQMLTLDVPQMSYWTPNQQHQPGHSTKTHRSLLPPPSLSFHRRR